MEILDALEARKLAIHACGLSASRQSSSSNIKSLGRAISNLGVLQIDSVNTVARSHLLALRPRMSGDHDSILGLLNRAAYPEAVSDRKITEYPCHEACYFDINDWPLYRWRMKESEDGKIWKHAANFISSNLAVVDEVLNTLDKHGACTFSELDAITGFVNTLPRKRKGEWSQNTPTKIVMGWLYRAGHIGIAQRPGFTRRYDLIERVLPSEIVNKDIGKNEAQRVLLMQAMRCLGVGTSDDLADYHRLPKKEAIARINELEEGGKIARIQVKGWSECAYREVGVGKSGVRSSSKSVLLSPFDPLVWYRPRAERMFDFFYRLEIYTPKAKRKYGYYVLPFLHESCLAGRVDVRADREQGVLRIPGAFMEKDSAYDGSRQKFESPAGSAMARELDDLARWLGLGKIVIAGAARGNFVKGLRKAISEYK